MELRLSAITKQTQALLTPSEEEAEREALLRRAMERKQERDQARERLLALDSQSKERHSQAYVWHPGDEVSASQRVNVGGWSVPLRRTAAPSETPSEARHLP